MRPHGTNASRDFGDTDMTYEFIQVDGYVDEQGNAGWNDCTVLDMFETTEGQLRRNFRKQLANVGFAFDRKKHKIIRYGEWDENLELEERESEVALFAAVTYEKRDAAELASHL